MNYKAWLTKIFSLLRIRPRVGGLEISDGALRYTFFDGENWQTAALRLPPNLVQGGQVENHSQFVEALRALREQIVGPRRQRQLSVVVSLSSVNIYSQVFSLPVIEGENLEKAIQLNIQMASPAEASKTYSGWQMVGEDQKSVRLEILSSFINKVIVDEITAALREAGFIVHSIESRALSLTRLIRNLSEGFDPEKSYIVLSLDSSGLEFMVIRRSQLYFQYFNSWRDLYGGEKQVSQEAFETALIRNLHQVLNFYNSHWSEPLSGIFVSANALKEGVNRIITENFGLTILELQIRINQPLGPDWYVALGSGYRGTFSQKEDREISLLGISAQDEFFRTQAVSFARFWRVAIPASLSMLLLVFFATDILLGRTHLALKSQVDSAGGEAQSEEFGRLQARVEEFNRSTRLIQASVAARGPKFGMLQKVSAIAESEGASLSRIYYQNPNVAIEVTGRMRSEAEIARLQETFKKDSAFLRVNIPYDKVRKDVEGVSFSMELFLNPAAAL